jgi:type I restriction enzyme S subunit
MPQQNHNVPKLRFPEFSGEWETKDFGKTYSFHNTNSLSRVQLNYDNGVIKNIHYGDIHTKFKSNFNIKQELVPYINSDIDIKIPEESFCKEGDLVIADASEDYKDIGKAIEIINTDGQKLTAGLHTYIARPIIEMAIGFGGYLMQTYNTRLQLMQIANGISVLGISKGNISKIRLNLTSKPEQIKIATFLTTVDDKISKLQEKKSLLEKYKSGVMQQIFEQKIRFTDDNGKAYPAWEEKTLGNLLDYEQPTNYIVSNTEYDNNHKTPVLTAGKSFILGYTNEEHGIFKENLPVIIFDDFTTASKFVNFPFKVKSSAMKILLPKEGANIKFVYEAMQNLNYIVGGHERHWISKFAYINIMTPHPDEQQKIANFLTSIDHKIEAVTTQATQAQTFKKGLLQQMFV